MKIQIKLTFAPKYYCFEYLNCWQVITYLTVKHNIASVFSSKSSIFALFHIWVFTSVELDWRTILSTLWCIWLLLQRAAAAIYCLRTTNKRHKKLTDNLWREIFSRGQKKIWNDHKNFKIDVVWPFVLSIFQLVKIPKEFWCTCSQSCQL